VIRFSNFTRVYITRRPKKGKTALALRYERVSWRDAYYARFFIYVYVCVYMYTRLGDNSCVTGRRRRTRRKKNYG